MRTAYFRNFTGRAKEEHISPEWKTLIEKANAGTLTSAEKDMIASTWDRDTGVHRLMGWVYNFRPVMKTYVVKTTYMVFETFGFNKAHARARARFNGKVIYIQEVN